MTIQAFGSIINLSQKWIIVSTGNGKWGEGKTAAEADGGAATTASNL